MAHTYNCEPCAYCKQKERMAARRRIMLHKARKNHMIAKRDAILAGKVQVISLRDDITGYFYRYDNKGHIVLLGNGDNKGA